MNILSRGHQLLCMASIGGWCRKYCMYTKGQHQKSNGHICSVCWPNSNLFSPKCSEYGWQHFLNSNYAPIGTANEVRFWMTLMAVIKVTYDVTIGCPLIIHLESLRPTLFPRTGLFLHPVYESWWSLISTHVLIIKPVLQFCFRWAVRVAKRCGSSFHHRRNCEVEVGQGEVAVNKRSPKADHRAAVGKSAYEIAKITYTMKHRADVRSREPPSVS